MKGYGEEGVVGCGYESNRELVISLVHTTSVVYLSDISPIFL
jgi:hypothetical protein